MRVCVCATQVHVVVDVVETGPTDVTFQFKVPVTSPKTSVHPLERLPLLQMRRQPAADTAS